MSHAVRMNESRHTYHKHEPALDESAAFLDRVQHIFCETAFAQLEMNPF